MLQKSWGERRESRKSLDIRRGRKKEGPLETFFVRERNQDHQKPSQEKRYFYEREE